MLSHCLILENCSLCLRNKIFYFFLNGKFPVRCCTTKRITQVKLHNSYESIWAHKKKRMKSYYINKNTFFFCWGYIHANQKVLKHLLLFRFEDFCIMLYEWNSYFNKTFSFNNDFYLVAKSLEIFIYIYPLP